MRRDHLPTAIDGLLGALSDIRCRQGSERAPPAVKRLKGRWVKRIIDPMTVPLERLAQRTDLGRNLCRLPVLGVQRIALLLEDFVNTLVLAANPFEKLPELRGILNGLRRQLPQSAGRTVHDQLREVFGIIDGGQ